MDTLSGPPFTVSEGVVSDGSYQEVELMGASRKILNMLATDPQWQDTAVAYVSRTDCTDWAEICLKLIQVADGISMYDLAKYQEIYPGNKKGHFKKIHQQSGIDYSDMVFFDNERRNIIDCNTLGITCIYTPNGMTDDAWAKGLAEHAAKVARWRGRFAGRSALSL